MPYSIEELKKRPAYQKIIDADRNERLKIIEDEEIRLQISGSTPDAINTLRNDDGIHLSYADPDKPNKTMESSTQRVRIHMTTFNANSKMVREKLTEERNFSDFRPVPDSSNPTANDLQKQKVEVDVKQAELDSLLASTTLEKENLETARTTLEVKIAEYTQLIADNSGG